MMAVNPWEHGGNVYQAGKVFGRQAGEFLDYSANIHPLGPPEGVLRAIQECAGEVIRYPDPAQRELRQAAATEWGGTQDCWVAGNGAAELLFLAVGVFRPKRALIPVPSFSEYARACRAWGVPVETRPAHVDRGFEPDLLSLAAEARPGDLVFLCRPNNPTGSYLGRTETTWLLERLGARGAYAVVDESFLDFMPAAKEESATVYCMTHPNAIAVRSLTKFYAMPGLRLGLAVGHPTRIQGFDELRDPWNVNILAHHAGVAAISDTDYPRRVRSWLSVEQPALVRGLEGLDLDVWPPKANFILVGTQRAGVTGQELFEGMARQGVLIRDAANFCGLSPFFVRVAVRTRQDNQTLLRLLARVLQEGDRFA